MFNISVLTRALLASQSILPLRFFATQATMGLPTPVPPNTPHVPGQGPAKIHLFTVGTPNGYKPSICLEELRAAYPELAKTKLSYDVYPISFAENQQKDPAFLKINPNGRIPAIVDDNAGGLNVFESASILVWLAEQYDPNYVLNFKDVNLHSEMMSWIFFAQGGPGPMMGQLGVFMRKEEKIPFAIKRYADESMRLLSVYEDALQNAEYLVGNRYSLADLNAFTWAAGYPPNVGLDLAKFPKVSAWIERIAARPAVKEGYKVPTEKTTISEAEQAKKREELQGYIREAEAESK